MPKLSIEREAPEQNQPPMPDNSELDSPTTVVGEEEHFPNSSEKELLIKNQILTEQLEHAEEFIKIFQAELENKEQKHSDYQSQVEFDAKMLRNSLKDLTNSLNQKEQTIFDLSRECDQLEAQIRVSEITFQKICRQRDDSWTRLGEFSYLLEQEILKNQIAYDTLKSVVLEREILAKKYALAKGKIERRQSKISRLGIEIENWTKKYWRERKGFIKHDIQLAQEQRRIKKLKRKNKELKQEFSELDDQYNKLEKQKNKVDTRLNEQVNNLKKLAENKKTIQKELEWARDDIEHLDFLLERRTEKLVRARSKIKDLENKQKELKTVAEDKKVSLALIKYTPFNFKKSEENPNLERDITNTSYSLIDTIADTQNHLGVSDLTQITTYQMPDGKGLKDLIDFYEENKDKAPTSPSQPQVITELELGEPNETTIVNQIIQDCDLGLNENSSLTQVIERINKLIKTKPPVVRPVKQPNDTPFGESLEKIIEIDLNSLEKELGIELSSEVKEQIERATNYQELSSIRNQEIKNYLEKNQTGIVTNQQEKTAVQPFKNERVIWISLLVVSLLAIGGLLIRLRKKRTNKPF